VTTPLTVAPTVVNGNPALLVHLDGEIDGATANLNPWTEAKADYKNPDRGPMLIISGEKDNTAPPAITNAIFEKQSKNPGVTETVTMPNRGHGLVVDHGWRDVCDVSLNFIKRWIR
jgi:non-heme chloroperoxidase